MGGVGTSWLLFVGCGVCFCACVSYAICFCHGGGGGGGLFKPVRRLLVPSGAVIVWSVGGWSSVFTGVWKGDLLH